MDKIYIAALLETPKISRKTVKFLIDNFKDNISTLQELKDLIIEGKYKNPRIQIPELSVLESAYEKTVSNFNKFESMGINTVDINDLKFPIDLKVIPNPPLILYYKGNIDYLKYRISIAIIGTRKPTDHGRKVAERLGEIIGKRDITVISGLAIGCDSAAHQGCLKGNGKTAAILAHGLDEVYPRSNRKLTEDILINDGCLISEYTIGTIPKQFNFVERNRIQSGLSKAVLIVETDKLGGTMQTAKFCEEQGKILACYSHDEKYLTYPQTRGNQLLIIEHKARPIGNETDLNEFLNYVEKISIKKLTHKEIELNNKSIEQMSMF